MSVAEISQASPNEDPTLKTETDISIQFGFLELAA